MVSQEMEKLLRRYVEEVWHQRNPDAVDDFLAPEYGRHVGAATQPLSREDQKALLRTFQAAFPDAHITIENVLVDGNMIALRSTFRGTHRDVFRGIPPTGRNVTVRLLDLFRVQNGHIAEQWGGPDLLDMLLQLGATVSTDTND
jgi:steroid delta-isomerase-like uncharacterized protein